MYRILLCEDDSALRYLYSRMKVWTEEGFVLAAQASNGKEALELLETQSFDLMLTDIRMPFVDGLSLIEQVKRRELDLFSVLVSSYNEFEYARDGLRLGVFDFLVKPVHEGDLAQVLNRARMHLNEKEQYHAVNRVVLSALKRQNISVKKGSFLHRVCLYLSENIGRFVKMEELAQYLDLSKDYFGKLFKQATEMSFTNFYAIIKVEYAKTLMKTGNYKNYEISERLGYASPDYFTKVFKECTGFTPSQYKAMRNH